MNRDARKKGQKVVEVNHSEWCAISVPYPGRMKKEVDDGRAR
jgi:hypothetical protein